MSTTALCRAAKESFGFPSLRPGQLEAMEHVLAGRDVLVVMPTGAGKSAVYQVPSVLLDGPTVVVSPLIALQRDQLASLAQHVRAGAANSAVGAGESQQALEALCAGELDVLLLSPEQLAKPEVLEAVAAAEPSLLVVDEAHCVSAWGHDFRPDYLRLGDAVDRLRPASVLALTATASPPVRSEVLERLRMTDPVQVVRGFDRPALHLEVQRFEDEDAKRAAVVARAMGEVKPGIVYVATRKGAEAYAAELADLGLDAAAYHAGMRVKDRDQAQERFTSGELDVVVATTAFGMGIDKADVRFVLHAEVADSLDSYYQEIGRAGRDGRPAQAVLFYREADVGLRRFFASGGVDESKLQRAVTLLSKAPGPVAPQELANEMGVKHTQLTRLVNLLEEVDAVVVTDDGALAVGELAPRSAARAAAEQAEAHRAVEDSRVSMARGYAETEGCRRQYLLGYFGEHLDEPCGNCDTCEAGTATAQPDAERSPFRLQQRVEHKAWGPGVVMRYEGDRVVVLFEQKGYRTLSLEAVLEHDLLVADG